MSRTRNTTTAPTGSIAPLGLRLLPALREQIEDAARAKGRSLNAEVTERLRASFDTPATERINELERALALEQLAKSEERMKAAHYASALRVVADRLPAKAFDDNPAIAKLLKSLDVDRKARVIATLEQMAQDKLQTLANLERLVPTGPIKPQQKQESKRTKRP